MEEQKSFVEGAGDLGGTMRLGLYPAALKEGSVVRAAYGEALIEERHRHRYEVNNRYRDQLERAGLVFSGTSPDNNLVEFVELPREVHPYYVSTQAHPELRSRPTRPTRCSRAWSARPSSASASCASRSTRAACAARTTPRTDRAVGQHGWSPRYVAEPPLPSLSSPREAAALLPPW